MWGPLLLTSKGPEQPCQVRMHRYGAGQERKQEKKEHCCVISANQFCFPFWVFGQITCLQLLFARKYKDENTVLARRNVAEGGAPGTPSSLVSCTSQSSLDIWSSWEAVCGAATPCWGLILVGSMWNPTVTTLMNTEGFLPAVKNARPLGCPQRPGSLEALSDFPAAEVFCVTNILKTTSEQYGSDCSTRLSNGFSNPLINFALFLGTGACASPALHPVTSSSPTGNTSSVSAFRKAGVSFGLSELKGIQLSFLQ